MKSGWFWGTERWDEYLVHYRKTVPAITYRSTPLKVDHDFTGWQDQGFRLTDRVTRVIDIQKGIKPRKSYRSLINQGRKKFAVHIENNTRILQQLHLKEAGRITRVQDTWDCMSEWILDECGMCLVAYQDGDPVAAGYFIVWQRGAYYACSAKAVPNAMHFLISEAAEYLQGIGVTQLEMGDQGWNTEKEFGIAQFKAGFGGVDYTYLLAEQQGGT